MTDGKKVITNEECVQSIEVVMADVGSKCKVLIDGKLLLCDVVGLQMDDPSRLICLKVEIPLICIPNRSVRYEQEEWA